MSVVYNIKDNILSYWNGSQSLSEAVKNVWLLGTILVSAVVTVIFLMSSYILGDIIKMFEDYLMFFINVTVALYHIFASVCVWRCAKNAIRSYWLYIARTYIFINMIFILNFFYKIIYYIDYGYSSIYDVNLY